MTATGPPAIVGRAVLVTASDPWECVGESGSGPFRGVVRAVGPDPDVAGKRALLVELEREIARGGGALLGTVERDLGHAGAP
jgi:hypothetical protein